MTEKMVVAVMGAGGMILFHEIARGAFLRAEDLRRAGLPGDVWGALGVVAAAVTAVSLGTMLAGIVAMVVEMMWEDR
jgi:hypothetical protein